VDEAGHTFQARVEPTCAPRGQTPALRRLSRRREVASVIAVTPAGQLYGWHVGGTVHGTDAVRALRHFRAAIGTPLLIVWDRLKAHRGPEVRHLLATQPVDFAAVYLPAYAPELNPEEQANAVLKRRLANAVPGSVAEVLDHVRRGIRYLQHQPMMVRHFFQHAGLMLSNFLDAH
jgi:transposase